MSRSHAWRLAGGAFALLAAAHASACATEPTGAGPRADVTALAAPCPTWAMPAYALVNDEGTLYMIDGVLRERAPAGAVDTLDLRGLVLERAAPARDGGDATFVARNTTTGAVALRVTRGCVSW